MKLLLSAFFGLLSRFTILQDIFMQNGSFFQHAAILLDSEEDLFSTNCSFITQYQNVRRFTQRSFNSNPSL